MSQYETTDALLAYLQSQGIVEKFVQYASKKGIKRRNILIHKSRKLLERHLYGNIIYNMLDKEAYIRYANQSDPTVKEAIKILEQGKAFPVALTPITPLTPIKKPKADTENGTREEKDAA